MSAPQPKQPFGLWWGLTRGMLAGLVLWLVLVLVAGAAIAYDSFGVPNYFSVHSITVLMEVVSAALMLPVFVVALGILGAIAGAVLGTSNSNCGAEAPPLPNAESLRRRDERREESSREIQPGAKPLSDIPPSDITLLC